MDPKPRPNHEQTIRVLRQMTPEQRLAKALELTELARERLRQGLRARFPHLDEASLHRLFLERIAESHNRDY